MDAKRFTDARTGDLVRAKTPAPDWAFVPWPLPPKGWSFPTHLYPLLVTAREALGTLNGIGSTLKNPNLLLHPLEDREALTSSSIEGTYATPEELLLYAQSPREPQSEHDPANTWREVFNYRRAVRQGHDDLKAFPFSLRMIKAMHETLLQGVRGTDKAPGEFRRIQVAVGSDRRYVPPPVPHIDSLLDNFQTYMNRPQKDDTTDSLVRCYIAHYQFEAIHPFRDGNGRIGRALLALMIASACKHKLPWLYLSAFFERFKDEYVEKMFRISTHGDWASWIEFCLRGTIEQAQDAIARCGKLQSLRGLYLERVNSDYGPRTFAIIDRLFDSPVITIADWSKQGHMSYTTAKSDLEYLATKRILEKVEKYYPASFYAPEIFDIAYGPSGVDSAADGDVSGGPPS